MTKKQIDAFEKKLLKRGYKKWTHALYDEEEYDVSKMVKDDEGNKQYQIIYRFWDFEKYKAGAGYSVDLVVMPCIDGRADMTLSNFGKFPISDVDQVEKLARLYFFFLKENGIR